jgi:hypothetical protein
LAPTIYTPGHAAYPSGHATQVHLIANLMDMIAPELATASRRLANRIAKNREVAGMHYPSDSAAGKWCADQIMTVLTASGAGASRVLHPPFQQLLDAARAEWRETGLTTKGLVDIPGGPLNLHGYIDGNDLATSDPKGPPRGTNLDG